MWLKRLLIVYIVSSTLLLLGFFLQSCTSIADVAVTKKIDADSCIIHAEDLTAQCNSRLGNGWETSLKLMDGWVCFNPMDMRVIIEKWQR